jgi:glucarate dehydratase
MKITGLKMTTVTVPLEAPLRWSLGVEEGTTRTILELFTDEGIVGLGETYGGESTARALDFAKRMIIGSDPLEVGKLLTRLRFFCISYETFLPPHVIAAVEMACWDIMGKALGRPVCSLQGGKYRDHVPFSAYLFFRYKSADSKGGEDTPQKLADYCEMVMEKDGFSILKVKGGVLPPEEEVETVRVLRERFPKAKIRFDPNAAWSVGTCINLLRKVSAAMVGPGSSQQIPSAERHFQSGLQA